MGRDLRGMGESEVWGKAWRRKGELAWTRSTYLGHANESKTNLKNVNVLYLKRGPFSHEMDSLSQTCSKTKPLSGNQNKMVLSLYACKTSHKDTPNPDTNGLKVNER